MGLKYSIFEAHESVDGDTWNVVAGRTHNFNTKGVIFFGPGAKRRAKEYADFMNKRQ